MRHGSRHGGDGTSTSGGYEGYADPGLDYNASTGEGLPAQSPGGVFSGLLLVFEVLTWLIRNCA